MQEIILEDFEGGLVGRVYVDGVKTSAYIIPLQENRYLFSNEQLSKIDNQMF